ncbi:hypothetical protein PSCICO_31990 [Pseudomonas cichorii]|nr:hypothetical protein PSCICO_31990 [Pseudomonas cichorii]
MNDAVKYGHIDYLGCEPPSVSGGGMLSWGSGVRIDDYIKDEANEKTEDLHEDRAELLRRAIEQESLLRWTDPDRYPLRFGCLCAQL